MSRLRRLAATGVLPLLWLTLLFLLALAVGWPERTIAVRIWLVGAGLVALRMLVGAVVRQPIAPWRDEFDRAVIGEPQAEEPPPRSFVEASRLVDVVAGTAGDVHYRVRPAFREIAAHRLLTRDGLLLDDPAQAAEVERRCGPLLWGIVRPDRPAPEDRRLHELDRAAADELVARLETL
ncbi:MAG: hypothetical protein JO291_03175 [Acidimicrobiia bacterium]|nr:hypothetical protein [Acidimicrobiia bacterium]